MAASEGGKAGCYEGTNGVPRQGSARSTLHLGLSDAQIAPRILTCGSLPRARILATAFDGGKAEHEVSSERGFVSLHGRVGGVRVSVVASGMGFPMLDFLVREALAILPPYDGESARALIVRYGSCGSIAPEVREGCVVVNSLGSTAIARLPDAFGSSGHIGEICPYKIHAVVPSDGPLSSALERELRAALGEGAVASGLNVSACSFYSSQGREDPAFDDGHAAFDPIAAVRAEHPTAVSLEMETFHLLDVSRCARPCGLAVRASAASIVVAHRPSGMVASAERVNELERVGGAAVLRALASTPLNPSDSPYAPASPSLASSPCPPLSVLAHEAPSPPNAAFPPSPPTVSKLTTPSPPPPAPVRVDYADLATGADLSPAIRLAFGPEGQGLLVVRSVPGVMEARKALLPLAFAFASLPAHARQACEISSSSYSVGWSHGRERLEGRPDLAKASFYANPLSDALGSPSSQEMRENPSFAHPNVWPVEIPALRPAFMALGKLVVEVGKLLAKQCDAHVTRELQGAEYTRLAPIVEDPRCCKARLLHYFPLADAATSPLSSPAPSGDRGFSDWCGWHNDHGSLTGLVAGMYIDSRSGEVLPASPDPSAGLYVRDRRGTLHHLPISEDEIAFQIGEAAQIHSGGVLQATPHAVRACDPASASSRYACREAFAVFMQPFWGEQMTVPRGIPPKVAMAQGAIGMLPPRVPSIESRWDDSLTFGDFTRKTHERYY